MESVERFLGEELRILRESSFQTRVENGMPFSPKLFCSWDQSQTGIEIEAASSPETLLTLDSKVQGAPQWLTLNFELGKQTIAAGDIIGLVARGASDQPCALPIMMRSYFDETSHDTPFGEDLVLSTNATNKTVLHTMSAPDEVGGKAAYRTLIISLPKRDGQIALHNLRLFRVPASHGLRSSAQTLSAF